MRNWDEQTGPRPVVMPTWMSDTPVTVDVNSLETFAKRIRTELETNVAPNVASIQNRLAGQGSYNPVYDGYDGPPEYVLGKNRTFGVDGAVPWASHLGLRHLECENSVRAYLYALQRGMASIAGAAEKIAGHYRTTEERNAMDVRQVARCFIDKPADPEAGSTGPDPAL